MDSSKRIRSKVNETKSTLTSSTGYFDPSNPGDREQKPQLAIGFQNVSQTPLSVVDPNTKSKSPFLGSLVNNAGSTINKVTDRVTTPREELIKHDLSSEQIPSAPPTAASTPSGALSTSRTRREPPFPLSYNGDETSPPPHLNIYTYTYKGSSQSSLNSREVAFFVCDGTERALIALGPTLGSVWDCVAPLGQKLRIQAEAYRRDLRVSSYYPYQLFAKSASDVAIPIDTEEDFMKVRPSLASGEMVLEAIEKMQTTTGSPKETQKSLLIFESREQDAEIEQTENEVVHPVELFGKNVVSANSDPKPYHTEIAQTTEPSVSVVHQSPSGRVAIEDASGANLPTNVTCQVEFSDAHRDSIDNPKALPLEQQIRCERDHLKINSIKEEASRIASTTNAQHLRFNEVAKVISERSKTAKTVKLQEGLAAETTTEAHTYDGLAVASVSIVMNPKGDNTQSQRPTPYPQTEVLTEKNFNSLNSPDDVENGESVALVGGDSVGELPGNKKSAAVLNPSRSKNDDISTPVYARIRFCFHNQYLIIKPGIGRRGFMGFFQGRDDVISSVPFRADTMLDGLNGNTAPTVFSFDPVQCQDPPGQEQTKLSVGTKRKYRLSTIVPKNKARLYLEWSENKKSYVINTDDNIKTSGLFDIEPYKEKRRGVDSQKVKEQSSGLGDTNLSELSSGTAAIDILSGKKKDTYFTIRSSKGYLCLTNNGFVHSLEPNALCVVTFDDVFGNKR